MDGGAAGMVGTTDMGCGGMVPGANICGMGDWLFLLLNLLQIPDLCIMLAEKGEYNEKTKI